MTETQSQSPAESLREYGRGISGGLLFSVPLLYTMEVWWQGFLTSPRQLLGFLVLVFFLLLGYNRHSGFRQDATWTEIVVDSIDALGVGLLTSAFILALLGRIDTSMPLDVIISEIAMEAGVVAIGISIGTSQLGEQQGNNGRSNGGKKEESQEPATSLALNQVIIGFFGGMVYAANIAPTEEVVVIAAESSFWKIIGIAIFSMLIAATILYYSEFSGSSEFAGAEKPLGIAAGIVTTYALALFTAAAVLWFIGRFGGAHPSYVVALTVVLAFPTVLGASAARLLLQTS